eukprot:m.104831 g.104831  ORF g.104831 m.104831 type:complete len:56 (+) comp37215_c0_seq5:1223-1390(+)
MMPNVLVGVCLSHTQLVRFLHNINFSFIQVRQLDSEKIKDGRKNKLQESCPKNEE